MDVQFEIRDRRKCEWFWCDKRILKSRMYPSTKMVYFALCCYSNENTQSCYPSVDTIAQIAGVSRRAVTYALHDLDKAGIIRLSKQKGKKNEYILKSVSSATVARVEVAQQTTRKSRNIIAQKSRNIIAHKQYKGTKQINKGFEKLRERMAELTNRKTISASV